jgi:hypothetical protein
VTSGRRRRFGRLDSGDELTAVLPWDNALNSAVRATSRLSANDTG